MLPSLRVVGVLPSVLIGILVVLTAVMLGAEILLPVLVGRMAFVLREVIVLYISVINSPSMYLQIQFQLVVYALEAYHRRITTIQENNLQKHNKKISDILRSCSPEYGSWLDEKLKYSYEPNLRHRLKELISEYEIIFSRFVSGNKGDFVNKVVNTRNYLTHYDQDLRHKAITDMDILHEVTQKLIGLLQVCLLIQVASVEEVKVIYKIKC
jgi:hypothetical protein